MNYRHAFHAGNHADVLKHVVLLALCDALVAKPTPVFALDTHTGRGLYALDSESAVRTGEASEGIDPVLQACIEDDWIQRYVRAVQACRDERGPSAYPGSPWLIAHALRDIDRMACCELQPEEVAALKANLSGDRRVAVHAHLQFGHLCHLHSHRSIRSMADVSHLPVCAPILDGNDEVFRQQGRQNPDVTLFVSLGPSLFHLYDFFGIRWLLLRHREECYTAQESGNNGTRSLCAHVHLSHSLKAAASR